MPTFLETVHSLYTKLMPSSLSRRILITCRGDYHPLVITLAICTRLTNTLGKTIDPDGLYRYTNGRFLVDEKNQCDRRYVKFNLDKLCEIASSAGSSRCLPTYQIRLLLPLFYYDITSFVWQQEYQMHEDIDLFVPYHIYLVGHRQLSCCSKRCSFSVPLYTSSRFISTFATSIPQSNSTQSKIHLPARTPYARLHCIPGRIHS